MLSPESFSTTRPVVPQVAAPKPYFPEEPMILVQRALDRALPMPSKVTGRVMGVDAN
jgi:hypothetical protein